MIVITILLSFPIKCNIEDEYYIDLYKFDIDDNLSLLSFLVKYNIKDK